VQPPASLQALGDPLYEVFYGLNEQPFSISTDPKFLFPSASHQTAYQELLQGLQRREGLLLMTGETGTGKTTLCRALLDSLGPRTFSAIVLNPYMTGTELLKLILRDFGLVSRDEVRRGALATADTARMLDLLEGFLLSIRSVNSYAVIVVDEAQSLAPAVLDQVRLLTAIERQGERLVQVMLCGQPALLATLKRDSLYALNERITRRVHLAPLAPDEIDAYIRHRLSVAGGAERVGFDREATVLIADLSRGLPRRVNLLCDRSLQAGRTENAHVITAATVKRAARHLAGAGAKLDVMNAVLESLAPDTAPIEPVSAEHAPSPVAPGPAEEAVEPAQPATSGEGPVEPTGRSDEPQARESVWPAFEPSEAVPPEQVAAEATTTSGSLLNAGTMPAAAGTRRRVLVVAVAVVILAAGAYLLYARNTLVTDPNVPPAPASPPVDAAELPPDALPPPEAAEDVPAFMRPATPAPVPRATPRPVPPAPPPPTPSDPGPATAPAPAPTEAAPPNAPPAADPQDAPAGAEPVPDSGA